MNEDAVVPHESHWGVDPAHGGLCMHRGSQDKCWAPDCMDINTHQGGWHDDEGNFWPYNVGAERQEP